MFDRAADRWQLGLLLVGLLLGMWAWGQLPSDARVPIHFDMQGVADGWGSPALACFFLPGLAAALWGLNRMLGKAIPGASEVERARQARALDPIFLAVTVLMLAAQTLIVVVALSSWRPAAVHFLPVLALFLLVVGSAVFRWLNPRDPALAASSRAVATIRWAVLGLLVVLLALIASESLGGGPSALHPVPLMVGTLLIVTGNVMGKLRPNARVGIRTPWTLANARVWDQTHRFGGKAQVLAGALLLGLAFAPWPPAWQGPTVAVVVLVASGAAVLKSYLLWRALPPASRGGRTAKPYGRRGPSWRPRAGLRATGRRPSTGPDRRASPA